MADFRTIVAVPTLANDPRVLACLDSLQRQTAANFLTVLIDNSGRGALRQFDLRPYRVEVLDPGRNLGYGGAVNLAWRRYRPRFLAVLNDDAEADARWLEALLEAMNSGGRTGMCASHVVLAEGNRLDSAGMLIARDGSSKQRGHGCPRGMFLQPEETLLPSGSAALYRGEMLEEAGLFDEDFFLYCEDTDLGLRARWAGWRCRYVPDAVVLHHYSHSVGRASPMKAYLVERNRLYLAVKNFPAPDLLLAPLFSVLRYAWHVWFLIAGRGKAAEFQRQSGGAWRLAYYVVKAHLALVPALPRLLRLRRSVRRRARLSVAEYRALLRRFSIPLREVAAL